MRRLILMRHAKSDWSINGDDHARPLNARGRKSAPAMGDWLRRKGWLPDEVLCSTATRTRQTCDLLGLDLPPVQFEKDLYLAEAHEIIAVARSARGKTVLLIGHNHGIAEAAHRLAAAPPDHDRFFDYPTCATTLITVDVDDWSSLTEKAGRCVGFAVPREVLG